MAIRTQIRPVRFIALDPGWNTGFAVFGSAALPLKTGVLRATRGDWQAKTIKLADDFDVLLRDDPLIQLVVCEMPSYWKGSERGQIAADKNFLTHLAMLVGMYGGIALGQRRVFKAIDVREWKSQLSKSAVDKRIERRLGVKYANHISDAVGIGLRELGVFDPVNELKGAVK